MDITLSPEEIRYLLQNAGKIKRDGRCINCNGTGWENWNGETGGDIRPGAVDISIFGNEDRICGECEECEGVGFIW